MTNSPLPPIEEHNLSLAWGKAFLNAMDCPQANPGPMVVSITGFEKGVPIEDGRIRSKLDQFLAAFKKHPCSVSAMIIFPYPQWERMGRPSCAEFKQWCIKGFIPRLKARCKQNGKGLYFERMLDFHGGIPEGLPGKNQLLHLIEWWQEQKQRHHNRPPRSRMQVVCFDPFLDHNREVRPYFPCLQQVGFCYDEDEGLTVTAFYPTQYIFDRAYGNYLGLCHLGAFMAHQMDLTLVRCNCLIGRAEIGNPSKEDLEPLREFVQGVIDEGEGKNEA